METAQKPLILIPENPSFVVTVSSIVLDNVSPQLIFAENPNAIFRSIGFYDASGLVYYGFDSPALGAGQGFVLPARKTDTYLIDSKVMLWARGEVWGLADVAAANVALCEISLDIR